MPGAVISASHNPYDDNGIKLFSLFGTKLPVEMEADIERELGGVGRSRAPAARPTGLGVGRLWVDVGAAETYVARLAGSLEAGASTGCVWWSTVPTERRA